MKTTVHVKTLGPCQPCRMTKIKLDSLGIVYTTLSADEDPAVTDALKARGFLESPVVELHDESGALVDAWSGLRPDKIAHYFGTGR